MNLTGMMRSFAFVARSAGDDGDVVRAIRQTVRGIDATMPIVGPSLMTDMVAGSMTDRRFNTYAIGAFAVLALLLASVGIYGLIAFFVVQRSREIAVRLALGALPGDVVRLVLAHGARLSAVGIAIGLVGTIAIARLMRSLLFDVSPFDITSFAFASALLLAVAVAASLMPARRAARLDPQETLRMD